MRWLQIPCVRDRVAQTSAAMILEKLFEPAMHDASYAYRPGRHVYQAAGRIADYRLRGHEWAVRCDIHDCFGNIGHKILMRRMEEFIPCQRTMSLVRLWLRGFSPRGKGISQGSPLSPLLANIYLSPVDMALRGKRAGFVRYADDFLIVGRDRKAVLNMLKRLEIQLGKLGMELAARKTLLTHFSTGFEFLGFWFHEHEITIIQTEKSSGGGWVVASGRHAPDCA